MLCACLLALCVCAGAFAALVRPSAAAQAGTRAVFTRRYDAAYASAGNLEVRDPFTGRQFYMPAGLAMLFTGSDAGVHAYCIQKGQEIFDTGGITRRAYSLYDGMFRGFRARRRRTSRWSPCSAIPIKVQRSLARTKPPPTRPRSCCCGRASWAIATALLSARTAGSPTPISRVGPTRAQKQCTRPWRGAYRSFCAHRASCRAKR